MAVQEGSTVCGLNGRRYTLEKEIGAGGEGRVYRIAGQKLVGKRSKAKSAIWCSIPSRIFGTARER